MKPAFFIVFLLFVSFVHAFPVIVTTSDFNVTETKEFIYNIRSPLINELYRIDFTTKVPLKYDAYYYTFWDNNHNCYNSRVWISKLDYDLFIHELRHHDYYCNIKGSSFIKSELWARLYNFKGGIYGN